MSLRSVQSPNIFRVLQENTLFFIYNQGFSSKLKKLSVKLKVSKDPVTLFDDKWLKRKLIYLFTKQIKHFAQSMLSRARPIYRNIGKGGICHSWQKHSKATKEKTCSAPTQCVATKGNTARMRLNPILFTVPQKSCLSPTLYVP